MKLKIIKLEAPVDDEKLELKKGDGYYVFTHADGVDGLKEFILKIAPVYELATETQDGLLSKEDKQKLNQWNPVEINKRLAWLENHIKG